jgi:diguanylate cyclase (GGDEF)-like protein
MESPKAISALLVEDSPDDAMLVRDMLDHDTTSLVQMSHVERLAEARQLLSESHFDCLLLDLSLPDADQLEALSELCSLRSDTPIVVLSGLDDEQLATQAVRAGAQDYLVKGRFDGHLLGRSISYAIERKLGELALAQEAMRDALTGLPNRALFMDHLKQTLARSKRHHSPFALLFLDLDGFKLINDSFGHEAGDKVLTATAERLRQDLRETDTPARFGGDEFTVLCEDIVDGKHAAQIAERVLHSLDAPIVMDDGTAFLTASIGALVVSAPSHDTDVASLMRAGDRAMYRAKERKNSYELCYYSGSAEAPEVEDTARREPGAQMEAELVALYTDG